MSVESYKKKINSETVDQKRSFVSNAYPYENCKLFTPKSIVFEKELR